MKPVAPVMITFIDKASWFHLKSIWVQQIPHHTEYLQRRQVSLKIALNIKKIVLVPEPGARRLPKSRPGRKSKPPA
jgi:hypothetical protein